MKNLFICILAVIVIWLWIAYIVNEYTLFFSEAIVRAAFALPSWLFILATGFELLLPDEK